jgi:hypothetical protein
MNSRLVQPHTEGDWREARRLIEEYALSLDLDLSFQNFAHAVEVGKLTYDSFESDRALTGQESFLSLNLAVPFPDVLRYYFNCKHCGNGFGLRVETYHGQGGEWSKLGDVDLKER